MKKSKIITLSVVSVALLISICTFASVLNNYKEQTKNTIKSLQLVKSSGNSSFTVKDYENILKSYDELNDIAICGDLGSKSVKDTTVTPVLVNENYLAYNNFDFEGEGITEDMVKNNSKTAVVGKTFAKKHFYGKTAIGKTFKLDGVRYRVTGIYNDKNDKLNNLFKDGKERIYINYSAFDNYENLKIDTISCVDNTTASRRFYYAGIDNFKRVDFDERNMAVNDFTALISFVLTVIISFYLLRLWLYSLGSTGRFLKASHSKNYLFPMIRNNLPSLLLRLLIFLALPVGIFLLFILCFRNFHIVYNYIDTENLFSVSHMLDTLGSVLGKEHTTLFGGNTYFTNLYNGTLLILLGLVPVVLALFFFFYYLFCSISKESNLVKYIVIAVFSAVTITSLIVSLTTGLSYSFLEISALITGILILKSIKGYVIKKNED
ncbi:MAG: ABC transporter permease [Ruminococcus sp.]